MKRLMLYAALLGALSLVLAPAQAEEEKYKGHSVTRCYLVGGSVQDSGGRIGFGSLPGGTCPNFGGSVFGAAADGLGEIPVTVTVVSAGEGIVRYTICQSPDGDSLCGETGEPVVRGCGSLVDLTTSAIPFDPALDITVFVGLAHTDCSGGIGSGGSITIEYVVPEDEEEVP